MTGEGEKILIVDDDQEIHAVTKMALADVIISDIIMPINDGFELVSQLSQHEKTSHIKTVTTHIELTQ